MIRALLGSGEPADRLLQQVSESSDLERSSDGRWYALVVPETVEDLLIDLDDDLVTSWQPVRDALTGERLEFRIALGRGGFFRRLEGRTPHSAWPDHWRVDDSELKSISGLDLAPPQTSCAALLEWLGDQATRVDPSQLDCRTPADLSSIRQVERREGSSLPPDYAELLLRSDGLTVGHTEILGSRDLFVTDLADEAWWVVASRRGSSFVVTHRDGAETSYFRVDQGQYDPRDSVALASTARELIAQLTIEEG